MSDLSLLAAVLTKSPPCQIPQKPQASVNSAETTFDWAASQAPQAAKRVVRDVYPETHCNPAEFSSSNTQVPRSGVQLYYQRWAALRAGRLYTRLPGDSFRDFWSKATGQPSYEQWRKLLTLEARAVAKGQGSNRLGVLLGDSLSLWFPSDRLPSDALWLNQSVSGDTTRGVLQRLPDFSKTRPAIIYVMAGINDLKQGASDREILWNLQQIIQRLQQAHSQARIVVQSILPTRHPNISNQRIQQLNRYLAAIAHDRGAVYLDLYPQFVDDQGQLQPEFTTDGLHLNAYGYETWRSALQQVELRIARGQ